MSAARRATQTILSNASSFLSVPTLPQGCPPCCAGVAKTAPKPSSRPEADGYATTGKQPPYQVCSNCQSGDYSCIAASCDRCYGHRATGEVVEEGLQAAGKARASYMPSIQSCCQLLSSCNCSQQPAHQVLVLASYMPCVKFCCQLLSGCKLQPTASTSVLVHAWATLHDCVYSRHASPLAAILMIWHPKLGQAAGNT